MKIEESFIKLCNVNDIPEGKGIRIEINDHDLAIFKVNDKVFVISNICPHNHTAQIFNGHLSGYSITCPVHGWKFDLKTGKTLNNHSNIKTYKTKIVNNILYVNLPNKFFNW